MNKEEINNLLLLLFNDNLTDCGKRKLKHYIEDLQHQLEEKDKVIKKAIEFIKDEGLYEEDFKIFNDDINFNELSKLLKILERNKE